MGEYIGREMVRMLLRDGRVRFDVQVADPIAYPAEAEHEYGITLTPI